MTVSNNNLHNKKNKIMDITSFQLLLVIVALALVYNTIKLLNKFWKNLEKTEKVPKFQLTFFINNYKIKGEITMLLLKNDQLARFVVGSPKDIKGDDTSIQAGSLKVRSSNPDVFAVDRDEKDPENEMAWKVVAGRKGAAVLTIEADADLGEGVQTVTAEIAVEVTSSEAVSFGEPSFVIEDQVLTPGGGEEQPTE
jgi:hypothetical protein